MHFDSTVTLGAVLNMITIAMGILVFGLRLDGRLKITERLIGVHELAVTKIMAILDELRSDVAYLRGVSDQQEKYKQAARAAITHLKDRY